MSASYMRRCAGKERIPDRRAVTTVMTALTGKKGRKVNAYRCDQCLGWHVGGTGNRFRGRLKRRKRPNKRMRGRV